MTAPRVHGQELDDIDRHIAEASDALKICTGAS